MAQKEVSIKDYTVDRKYTSRITLEEFIRRMIRSHADAGSAEPEIEKPENTGSREDTET